MIPKYDYQATNLEEVEKSNLTYKLDFKRKRLIGIIDELEAVKQSVYKILNTERQSKLIYNQDYGVELQRFIGQDEDFVKSDLQRTITEALLADDRILEVKDFTLNPLESNLITINFSVISVFGDISLKSEVSI